MSETRNQWTKVKERNLVKDDKLIKKEPANETEHYYNVKLPTYEESQRKYMRFLNVLIDK